jgi:tetratricopeptide (TPR) repeat protein
MRWSHLRTWSSSLHYLSIIMSNCIKYQEMSRKPFPILQLVLVGILLFCNGEGAQAEATSPIQQDAEHVEGEVDPSYVRELAEVDKNSIQAIPPEHLRLDPMFAEFPDLFRSPDIKFDTHSELDQRRDLGFRAQLELGLQHRRAGEYDFAVSALVKLLEKQPPVDYRKQAMLQLALIAELRKDWVKAHQIYRHYESLYPKDPNLPLVSLRLGLIYREMGADDLALSNLHSIIMMALKSEVVHGKYFPLYRRIVLKAKTEIANTHLGNGDFETAARHYRMLIADEGGNDELGRLNLPSVRFKLCKCLSVLNDYSGLDREVTAFLSDHEGHELEADVRYLAVKSLQARKNYNEVFSQFRKILEIQPSSEGASQDSSDRWKLRVGLEVASQMVQSGDYVDSLRVYEALRDFAVEAEDEVTIQYQMGLVYERLHQPARAMVTYEKIQKQLSKRTDPRAESSSSLIADMTGWRIGMLDWFRKKQLVLERMKDDNLSRSGTSDD